QRRHEVFGHRAGVASRRGAESDAVGLQVGLVDMVDADGGGADELHVRAVEQVGVDLGDAADEESVGPGGLHVGGGELAAVEGGDGAVSAEDLTALGDVFVDEDVHGGGNVAAGGRRFGEEWQMRTQEYSMIVWLRRNH